MTADTATINQNHTQIELDEAYDEFVKKAVKQGLQSIEEGKVHDLEDVMKELDI
ncbi:MAG: hypothetical protein HRU03_03695 [Nanoarchaeales archaeon]|nr:hypothetical protein [Nanoarchaeales archaeon]